MTMRTLTLRGLIGTAIMLTGLGGARAQQLSEPGMPEPAPGPMRLGPDAAAADPAPLFGSPDAEVRSQRPFFAPGDSAPPRPAAAVANPGVAPAQPAPTVAGLPPEDQPEPSLEAKLPMRLQRQTVRYETKERPGTIVIDTANTHLYYVLGQGQAMRYGIGVGREGFTWSGRERVSRMKEWPDWYPPAEMIDRQPDLPRMMAGGPGNPLGARALYLGHTLYRIHGTNQPSTIGKFMSSGCIRMLNEDVEDLYGRVHVGTQVVVLPGKPPVTAQREN